MSDELNKSTSEIIKLETTKIIAGLATATSLERKEVSLIVGRALQGLISGKFLSSLKEEWDALVKEGKVKKDYESSIQHMEDIELSTLALI